MTDSTRAALGAQPDEEIEAEWADYARIEPGEYAAISLSAKWEFSERYGKWDFKVSFDVFDTAGINILGTAARYYNGGSGDKPFAGPDSLFYKAWITANGRAPVRKDRLSAKVFVNRKATVLVGDTTGTRPHPAVKEILSWESGFLNDQKEAPASSSRSTSTSSSSSTVHLHRPALPPPLAPPPSLALAPFPHLRPPVKDAQDALKSRPHNQPLTMELKSDGRLDLESDPWDDPARDCDPPEPSDEELALFVESPGLSDEELALYAAAFEQEGI